MSHPSAGIPLLVIISAVQVLLLLSSAASAFNITVLLSSYPGFEKFNELLSRTHLAADINSRQTITVLGLPNDRLSALLQMPEDAQKSILSLHVILDYYDMIKINKLPPASKTTLTTLYQSSGVAGDHQGFVDLVHRRDGTIVFGSSMPAAPLASNLINAVVSYPYNISLLSVSQPIIAPGMDGSYVDPAHPPPAAAPKNPPPPPTASAASPPPAAAPKKSPPPAVSPVADAPAPGPGPAAADAPAPGPDGEAEAPAADEAEEETPADQTAERKRSAAVKEAVGGVKFGLVMVIGLVSFLAAH